jgi:hypothetical protein
MKSAAFYSAFLLLGLYLSPANAWLIWIVTLAAVGAHIAGYMIRR